MGLHSGVNNQVGKLKELPAAAEGLIPLVRARLFLGLRVGAVVEILTETGERILSVWISEQKW